MFVLRHKGDGWYWNGEGWTNMAHCVKRLVYQSALDQAEAFAIAADQPMVDVVSESTMVHELRRNLPGVTT